jgi:hypothetical protein
LRDPSGLRLLSDGSHAATPPGSRPLGEAGEHDRLHIVIPAGGEAIAISQRYFEGSTGKPP